MFVVDPPIFCCFGLVESLVGSQGGAGRAAHGDGETHQGLIACGKPTMNVDDVAEPGNHDCFPCCPTLLVG